MAQPTVAPAPAPAGLQQWTDAAARLQGQTPGPARTEPAAPEGAPRPAAGSQVPWKIEDEKSGSKFAVKVGRGVLWGVVALAAITGIRSWFWTPAPPKPAPTKVDSGPQYPVQEAQAVAARFARSYLTWDEADPQARAGALARDMPRGAETAAGWNSKGHQEVLVVLPSTVSVLGDKRARVRVDLLVSGPAPTDSAPADKDKDKGDKKDEPKKDDAKKDAKPASATRWMGLEVPVVQASGRVVVTGEPGIVGVPNSGPSVPAPAAKSNDMEFSDKTRGVVEEFFSKYAAGESDSVAAPGASIPALPSGMTLGTIRNWTVDEGSGTDRVGTAVVIWNVGGAEIEQTYRVKLTRVSSAQAERWQVAEVHGGFTP
ncbi:conjugal transfer protein [Streptomyces hesseae]|uniref:Conjugal transfer protein n=1 Tax=Streptomyces hesseae TaxID=3075519 RepID=A0ABU2SRX9_9ACTN|nr:conjugal transfer protein [Streptomyces sp. DSM 40473]MDT0451411.1 conjugal transfer protein [Streptomyces sp. DSM 40473]